MLFGPRASLVALGSFVLAFCTAPLFARETALSVDKVEPPNWWVHHTISNVQLLIHGAGLNKAKVTGPSCLSLDEAHSNAAGTYLFVNVAIADSCQSGDYSLTVSGTQGQAKVPFRLDDPLAPEGRFHGFSPDDVIYLIMPDRFANGDQSNDDPAISPHLFDPSDPRRYHGGDFQGIIDRLPYLKSLGVTTLWLTPVYDNTNKANAEQAVNGKPIADYHGYGTVDYYGVEEHFGSLALLKKLVDNAHSMGLKVVQDQVANHVGPAHPWVKDSPKPTWFHGTVSQHINETWQIWNLPDSHTDSVLKHNVLDGWFVNVLPDMNQDDPDVARYEIQNALWWVGVTGFDGIRQDTLPYVPTTFWHQWSEAIHRQYPNLRMVGEVFDSNPAVPSYFQGGAAHDGVDSGVDSVFDFPTFFSIRDVFAHGKDMDGLAKVLAEDRLYPNPSMLVPFEGNHDVMRFMSEPGATKEGLKLAFTYLLTTRGVPEIYYGDEIGMTGGDDPENRHDFPAGNHADNEIFQHVQKLLRLRSEIEPLRRGEFTSLALDAKSWVYARQNDAGIAIIALNNSPAALDIDLQLAQDGDYTPRLGSAPALTISHGAGRIHLGPRSAEIFSRTSRK